MARLHELASLTLFRATPAQVLESRRRTWPEWGGVLTEGQYLERDNQMDAMEHATDSKTITWVLAPRDNPNTLDFASACETYKRKGLVRYSGSREVQEATCYGVACVFTPPHKRGKGYASHMLRLLHWVTSRRTSEPGPLFHFPAEWGVPPSEVEEVENGLFSILYSAVGDSFYWETGPGVEKSGGWETRHPISTIWEVPEQGEVEQGDTDNEWTSLKYEDLDAFWAKDVQLIRRMMEILPLSSPDYHTERPTAFVTYLPDRGVGSFHIFRSMFAVDSIVSMDIWGIEKKGSCTDQPIYATWTVDTKPLPPVLVITRLSATEADFPALVKRIQEIARRNRIRKMEAWNVPSYLLEAAARTGGKTFARQKRLPAFKWYGEGETAEVEWVFNEKFCWC
ncbi:hypothetical protein L210DRAFT_3474926 [Boletus edulis BED1]|uniref:LYC1 C-terminal domain-containing protein n=1 Tax=Boletus edulis BED1 TaxID=1328754 RepID=A0AAD4C226_BOLED|nr:hypothetical protein L210DRAFT_3474926 [Boletus edulis BED1]